MAKERECIKWLAHTFLALHIDLLWGLTCIILPACASFLLLFPHTPLSDRLVLLYVWLWASTSRPVWLWPLCKEPTWTKFFFQFINVPMSEIRITTVIPNPFLGLWPHSDITNFWRHFSSRHLGSHVTAAVPAQIFSYADLIWTWLMFMKVGRLKKKLFGGQRSSKHAAALLCRTTPFHRKTSLLRCTACFWATSALARSWTTSSLMCKNISWSFVWTEVVPKLVPEYECELSVWPFDGLGNCPGNCPGCWPRPRTLTL